MKVPARSSAPSIGQRRSSLRLLSHIGLLSLITLGPHSAPAKAQKTILLVGAVSTVPAPLYNSWTQEYGKLNPNIQIRSLPVGTSQEINETTHGVWVAC